MRRFPRAAFAIVGCAAVVFAQFPVLATDSRPRIVVEPRTVDLGRIPLGETAKATYRIRNAGSALLEIASVDSRCGCIATLLSAPTVAPGESASIVATVDLRRMTNGGAKQIVVRSNDPTHPAVTVTLQAEVAWPFRLSDRVVHFGDVPAGESHTRSIALQANEGMLPEVERAWSDTGFVNVRARIQPDAAETHIEATLQPNAPLGELRAQLHVMVAGESETHFVVPVHGYITGPVVIEPRTLGLGHLRPGKTAERVLTVSAPHTEGFAITGVTATSPYLTPTLVEGEDGLYHITVGLTEHVPEGLLEGALKVRTTLASAPLVTVPVSVVVR